MLQIEATFWAAEADAELIKRLCANATSCRVTGTVNTHWKDFCARNLAREAGLKSVAWERMADDTPASLTFFLTARLRALPTFISLLHICQGVDEYECYLNGDADSAAPDDGNGSLDGAADGH